MSPLLSLSVVFCLLGAIVAAPVETSTEFSTESTTISWVANSDIRKHINLINEFARIREELSEVVDSTATPDDSMISMPDIDDGIEATQTLIHKFFAIKKDLETKKKEYEMMTTTTTVSTTPASKSFFKKLFNKIGFFD